MHPVRYAMAESNSGYTLVELLVTLTVVGMLVLCAIPRFSDLFQRTKQQTLHQQLISAIALTRDEAVARHARVTLCPSHDFKSCSAHWENGWIIFSDKQLLHTIQWPDVPGQLHLRAFPQSKSQITYFANGMSAIENGTFWLCPSKADYPVWAVILNRFGRVRSLLPSADNTLLDQKQQPLLCE